MDKNGLDKRVAIVAAVAATAIVLFGGFAIPSVYAAATVFRTDFDGGLIPACTDEQVNFSGTAQFVFQDVNGRQTVQMHYVNVKGVGVDTGTKYVFTEHDKYVQIVDSNNGDTTFNTSIQGNAISSGSSINTLIKLKLVTVVHANGDIETIVDDARVTCAG